MNRGQGPGVPEGYNSVSPWVISRDTNAVIEFAKAAFGADEIGRVADERGVIGHAEFRIGDSVVLAFDGKPHWPDTPAFLRLYVEDADATFRRALDVGGVAVTNVTHLFWGDRIGRVLRSDGQLVVDPGPCRGRRRGRDEPPHERPGLAGADGLRPERGSVRQERRVVRPQGCRLFTDLERCR